MGKGDITQINDLKSVNEEDFYFLLQNHEKRAELEAKFPRMSLF